MNCEKERQKCGCESECSNSNSLVQCDRQAQGLHVIKTQIEKAPFNRPLTAVLEVTFSINFPPSCPKNAKVFLFLFFTFFHGVHSLPMIEIVNNIFHKISHE